MDEWVKLNPPGGRTSSAVMGKIITLQITLISVSLLGNI